MVRLLILLLTVVSIAFAVTGANSQVFGDLDEFNDDEDMPTFEIVQNANIFGSENRSEAMQDDSDPLVVLAGLQSANVLSKSLLHKKAMSVNPDVSKPTFFNLTELEKKLDFPVNYGLSTVLSSDILALKSGVENLENSLCKNQSLLLLRGMLLGKNWALKSESYTYVLLLRNT